VETGRAHRLSVIEDGAHSLGATYKGKPVGAVSPITCFSFQAIKLLTTGDGGMVCVPSAGAYERAIRLRWYGIDRFNRKPSILGEPEWNVTDLGYKYHMNDVAAAMGLGNLEDIDRNLERRREIVAAYRAGLDGVPGVQLFKYSPDRASANWLFSIHVEGREAFCRMMAAKDIMTSVVHLRIDRNDLCGGERANLPELTRFTETHVSLPLHPFLTDDDIQRVIAAVRGGW
jgi:perosamine synthetase